ncbi:MAG: C4-dicarboxylate TRAP transporter substrate-binding protein [Halomonas sp.]|uniref:C4-dicarboxylate TRAP transporter substrate-binding protein n=1 Tax=Halomonas sp. TaxID=1486246 RepID=UPI00286FEF58|nr:C4-dicarboxylate TRAP transporter substrate-binding protein [Halomonas sp.]MDR9438360.1 C4-dicarboxylate TRAP transporter substrate-binding protein [Halomonas sp.]
MKLFKAGLAGALALGVGLASTNAVAAERITVNIGSSHPVQNIWVWAMKNVFQPEVDRLLEEQGGDYEIRWRENYGGTLYKFSETRKAVKDGIVDVGMIGTVWEESDLPLQNVTYYTPFATDDHKLIIQIFDDLSQNLPELRDSWHRENLVHLSTLVTDSYDIYGTSQIKTLDDIQNMRLNAPGTSANWLKGTGAIPVDGGLTTYYTNIQTGVTEGTLSFASGIGPARVQEVAPELTRVGFGSMAFGAVAVNKRFFDGLPEDVQAAFREAGGITSERHGEHVARTAEEWLAKMQEEGLVIHELPATEKQRWVDGLPNLVGPWLEANGQDAEVVLKAYFDKLRENGVEPLRAWDAAAR